MPVKDTRKQKVQNRGSQSAEGPRAHMPHRSIATKTEGLHEVTERHNESGQTSLRKSR